MQSILDTTKLFITNAVKCDDIAVDFTMGNGSDTLFLSKLVPEGKVYAFDIQEEAIISTDKLLKSENVTNCTLINACHSTACDYVNNIGVGMFNLGYLPGSDKSITTKRFTTLKAIESAMDMLRKGGVLTINVYPGHDEGRVEGEEIYAYLKNIDKKKFDCLIYRIFNIPECPYIYVVQKRI